MLLELQKQFVNLFYNVTGQDACRLVLTAHKQRHGVHSTRLVLESLSSL